MPSVDRSGDSLPGILAFDRRAIDAIDALNRALTEENVTEAMAACERLSGVLNGMVIRLGDLLDEDA